MFNEEDNVRLPDESFNDILIDNNNLQSSFISDEENQINIVINNSIQEFNEIQRIYDDYEKSILEEYENEKIKRKSQFSELLIILKKMSNYESKIKSIYELLEPIIDSYILCYIDNYVFDKVNYDTIFEELKNIRLTKESFDYLKILLKCDSVSQDYI
jgi:hypothetical protein